MTYGMEKDFVPKLLARSTEVQASLKDALHGKEPGVHHKAMTEAASMLEQMSDWLDRVSQRNDALVNEMHRRWKDQA